MIPNTLTNPYTITALLVSVLGILSLDWMPDFWYVSIFAIGSGSILLIISMFTMEKVEVKRHT